MLAARCLENYFSFGKSVNCAMLYVCVQWHEMRCNGSLPANDDDDDDDYRDEVTQWRHILPRTYTLVYDE